ncbi:MAG: prepilin-type N-terminal cleavage/methylation domain-containing protein [Candidatus Pacebacteria bacterium]|nr:prepilin-type N-terminal cleavage/methylation domain-containing protein [Candidatus Paceibacterota bacterium]
MQTRRGFTLIELIIVIAIIGILTAFIIANLTGSRALANDAVRKNDISNIYTSIIGKQTINGLSYPDVTSSIEPGKTNTILQSFIDQFLATTPYDPNPSKAYLYKGDGDNFSIAAILDDGSCFIKSTGSNLFGSDLACTAFVSGGIGLVQNFSLLHGSAYIDLIWSIPASLDSLPDTNVSSAIICLDSVTELDSNSLPSDDYLFEHGTIVAIVNNAYNQYRITLDNPDHYYYCKTYSYDNTVVTNPGTPGSSANRSTGGFGSSSSYSSSSPSTYTPAAASNPPALGGGTTTGGKTSPAFTATSFRNPDGTGTITLTWVPGYLSTNTIIRRLDNVPPATVAPQTLADGIQVYNERNDKDGQDPTDTHTYTDTGLTEDKIYCYSAWAYDSRTDAYSNGFVLACGGVPPSNPANLSISSTMNSFDLSWTKGSSTNSVIRRQIGTAPASIEEGVAVYNNTDTSFIDNDPALENGNTYCYSVWAYNPVTSAMSTEYLQGCGNLIEMGAPTNLTFPTVAYNSIIINWTRGDYATNTAIVRKQGSIPASNTDGTVIYTDNGNAFVDTGLTNNTQYCYALYSVDDEGGYGDNPLTGCQTTLPIVNGACGTAVRAFASGDTGYGSYTQCSTGTPSSTAFPAAGSSVTWTCLGSGGTNSGDCTASRIAAVAATCYPVDYNTSKVVNGETVWCDSSGGMWTSNQGSMTETVGASYCSSLNYAGTTGWALPTVTELNQCWSTVNCRATENSIAFWSATVYPDWTEMNWYVNLGQGGAGYNGANFRTSSYNIRCRHTSAPPTSCSVAEYNTTKVVNGETVWCDGNGGMWTNDRGAMSWDAANTHCSGLAYAGRYGWSLPSRTSLGQCCSNTLCRTSSNKTAYWTNTTFTDPNMVLKYYINLSDTGACYNGANTTNVSYRVRCRLGQ